MKAEEVTTKSTPHIAALSPGNWSIITAVSDVAVSSFYSMYERRATAMRNLTKKIRAIRYVSASNVFAKCPKVWDLFVGNEPAASWGDNERSCVLRSVIADPLRDLAEELEKDAPELRRQIAVVLCRLDSLDSSDGEHRDAKVLIDLES